ncbi:MAG TPA: hypothetical protein VNU68_32275 [Verrucomicrobiae bacterium]|nr:hypothetical protein [Verrucomicrobiae bacterium]
MGSLAAAQQLIDRLAQLDVSKGLLTPEDSQRLNKIFKELVAQGPAGIPAIRAFLERNEDLNFSDLKGGDLADYRSLRMGLLDALKQVGGPEAMAVSLQTLQHTADPWEVAVLARDLEQQAPGQFRQEALTAVRESLAQAVEGKLGERDVAPLFQVLQSYADASIVADLEKIPPQWSYYAAITLANLSGGEGIPALIRQVQDPTAMSSGQSDIALRCLAQASVEHPQASEALAEMARSSQISDTAWSAIASALAGYNLEIGKPLVNNSSGSIAGPGLEAYHLEDGGQNLFSTPVTASWLDETIDSRLAIIDRLLSANPSPTAAALLQQARASLASKAVALTIVPH